MNKDNELTKLFKQYLKDYFVIFTTLNAEQSKNEGTYISFITQTTNIKIGINYCNLVVRNKATVKQAGDIHNSWNVLNRPEVLQKFSSEVNNLMRRALMNSYGIKVRDKYIKEVEPYLNISEQIQSSVNSSSFSMSEINQGITLQADILEGEDCYLINEATVEFIGKNLSESVEDSFFKNSIFMDFIESLKEGGTDNDNTELIMIIVGMCLFIFSIIAVIIYYV